MVIGITISLEKSPKSRRVLLVQPLTAKNPTIPPAAANPCSKVSRGSLPPFNRSSRRSVNPAADPSIERPSSFWPGHALRTSDRVDIDPPW